jgi:hypothetical protein
LYLAKTIGRASASGAEGYRERILSGILFKLRRKSLVHIFFCRASSNDGAAYATSYLAFFDANRALSMHSRANLMTPWRSPLAEREHRVTRTGDGDG